MHNVSGRQAHYCHPHHSWGTAAAAAIQMREEEESKLAVCVNGEMEIQYRNGNNLTWGMRRRAAVKNIA
jgi:hypothetical protein